MRVSWTRRRVERKVSSSVENFERNKEILERNFSEIDTEIFNIVKCPENFSHENWLNNF